MAQIQQLSVEDVCGLSPKAWICVGAGYSREDIKSTLLAQNSRGFVGEAVTSLSDLASLIIPDFDRERVLTPAARQEVLRALLADRRIAEVSGGFPELKRLKRQSRFFKKMDLAIQSGRLSFAHTEEEQVYLERLAARLGSSAFRQVRDETRKLSLAYESWLEAYQLWDQPRLYQAATQVLESHGWPDRLKRPEKLYLFSNQFPESRERAFTDALSRFVEVLRDTGLTPALPAATAEVSWERWHTLDDGVEGMLDRILEEKFQASILIPDHPQVRRSLTRALKERGFPLADPRDPSRIRWDEAVKWALLPLEIVGRDFERDPVVSFCARDPELLAAGVIEEVNSRGIRQGLVSYRGGKLAQLYERLSLLAAKFQGKKTCAELAAAHLEYLTEGHPEADWILGFFQKFWEDYTAELKLLEFLELDKSKAPLRFWLERLSSRLQDATPPAEALKAINGMQIYRLSQAPPSVAEKIWILGLPAEFLGDVAVGDYWWSEREREILGAEFAVRSGIQVSQERLAALKAWFASAPRITLVDAQYDADGSERESIRSLVIELGREIGFGQGEPLEPIEKGAHSRWLSSYNALRPVQPQVVKLRPLQTTLAASEKPTLSATALDHYSRCAFQGLAYHRWKVQNQRDPDSELWPEVRGNILHQAVKHLLKTRNQDGSFSISTMEALERGWREKPPRGLLKSPRIEAYNKSRMLRILDIFCEKEREYFDRTHADSISLDEKSLRLEFEDFAVVGTPDRIDRVREGLFIMDYKSKSVVPNGTDMLDLGYCLQLPFYALAAAQQMQEPVVGLQFIQLIPKGTRSSGIFFTRYNGKEQGKLTKLTRASKSLVEMEPQDAWSRLHEAIEVHGKAYLGGVFDARPKKRERECLQCNVADLCGRRRVVKVEAEEGSPDDSA